MMKKLLILWSFFFATQAQANFAELYGASFFNSAIGNQGSYSENNAGNNYYFPSLLAFSKDFNLMTSLSSVGHSFKDISNIVVKNPTNSDPGVTEFGNVNSNYESLKIATFNLSIPIKKFGSLGFSFFLPVGSIMETNSGHSYLPEYVLYRGRSNRLITHLNYAHKYSEFLAFSIGFHLGIQVGANINTNASLNGTSYGSFATMKTQADPSLAGIFSMAYRLNSHQFTYTFQQEMKNNLQTITTGLTANPQVPFDITIDSMIFYDPHILRLGYQKKTFFGEFDFSLEYQIWENYKTPVIRIKKNSGVILGSDDFEKVETTNILVPHIGFSYEITDAISVSFGGKYKPSIFSHSFSGSGNSIDLNSYSISSGFSYQFNFKGFFVELGGSAQYHILDEKKITKTENLEDGETGSKIGYPGYTVGGNITVVSLGLSFRL